LSKPVLIGHSIAGEELSSIGSRHADRVAALVYLDAADAFAFYDGEGGDFRIDLNDVQRKLSTLAASPSRQLIDELLANAFPKFERDLRELTAGAPVAGPASSPPASFEDRASFATFRASYERSSGVSVPIAELREQFETQPDGSVG